MTQPDPTDTDLTDADDFVLGAGVTVMSWSLDSRPKMHWRAVLSWHHPDCWLRWKTTVNVTTEAPHWTYQTEIISHQRDLSQKDALNNVRKDRSAVDAIRVKLEALCELGVCGVHWIEIYECLKVDATDCTCTVRRLLPLNLTLT